MKPFSRRSTSANVPRRRQNTPEASLGTGGAPQRSFMRNQTISGTTQAQHEEMSPRTQLHALTARRRRMGAIFALIVGVIILFTILVSQFTAEVVVGIGSSGISRPVDTSIYTKAINTYLDSHPVERLRFALSKDQLSTYITSIDPEIASVTQDSVWEIGKTHFTITLRQPVAGWQINGQQDFVDSSGVAFEKNYFADPTVEIVDQSGVSLQAGTAITSTRFLSFVGKIVAFSKQKGYTVTQVTLPSGTTREVALQLANVSSTIKLSIDRGAGEQVEDMDRSIKYLSSKGSIPQYIDLRVAGRAFYE